MRYLRQNTATRVTVGPFIAVANGTTPLTAITATSEHLNLVVDDAGVPTLVLDAAATASGGNNDLVFITGSNAGFCDLELTAAQTNYVGRAMLSINFVTDHLPVFHEFMVLSAAAWDWMFGSTAPTVLLSPGTGTGQITLTSGAVTATDVAAIKTKTDYLPSATAGQANGLFIAGSNAATTIAGLTTGALASSSIAVSGTTTLTGAVSFGGAFGVTGTTTLAALTVTGTTTHTGTTVHTGHVSFADGVAIAAPSTAGRHGLAITGNAAGAGMILTGGNAAPGLYVTSSAESAAKFDGAGAGNAGLEVVGTGAGTFGLLASGVDGAIYGNITGNLSGTVASVTGNVAGAVVGAVGSVTGMTASDVAAIKAKTDLIFSTQAGSIDANIERINGVVITGTGAVGNEFGI